MNTKMLRAMLCVGVSVVLLGARPSLGAEVMVMGDSMMKSVGGSLRRTLAKRDIEVVEETSIGSGLARLDLLDWHAHARTAVEAHQPKTVFIMMGANDNQPMRTAVGVLPFGTKPWDMEYGRRIGTLMDVMLEGGAARVVWIGLPCMRDEKLSHDVQHMQQLAKQQASAREGVAFYSTVPIFCDRTGFQAYVKQDNGIPVAARAQDGIHFSRSGAEFLSQKLAETFFDQ